MMLFYASPGWRCRFSMAMLLSAMLLPLLSSGCLITIDRNPEDGDEGADLLIYQVTVDPPSQTIRIPVNSPVRPSIEFRLSGTCLPAPASSKPIANPEACFEAAAQPWAFHRSGFFPHPTIINGRDVEVSMSPGNQLINHVNSLDSAGSGGFTRLLAFLPRAVRPNSTIRGGGAKVSVILVNNQDQPIGDMTVEEPLIDSCGFAFSVDELDLATQVNTSLTKRLLLLNGGFSRFRVTEFNVSLPDEFEVNEPAVPFSLGSARLLTLGLTFSPTSSGQFSGSVTLVGGCLDPLGNLIPEEVREFRVDVEARGF